MNRCARKGEISELPVESKPTVIRPHRPAAFEGAETLRAQSALPRRDDKLATRYQSRIDLHQDLLSLTTD